jgi:hypothetical protein
MGLGRKAALAGLAALALGSALAQSAQGAAYDAEVQVGSGARGIVISASGDQVTAIAGSRGRDSVSGYYTGPGRVTTHGVSGRLGRFGSVRLRFQPEGKPEKTRRPGACSGTPRVYETWEGTYTGSVRFSPDGNLRGYIGKGTWKGSMGTALRWRCKGEEGKPEFDPEAGGVVVDAATCEGPYFQANVEVDPASPRPPPGDGTWTTADFSAGWTKTVGIAQVTYAISVEGGPKTALFADDLSEGTLRPPAPFHGEATIRRAGETWEWSGDLTARFPGHTALLTGPEFKPYVSTYEPRPNTAYLFGFSLRCK